MMKYYGLFTGIKKTVHIFTSGTSDSRELMYEIALGDNAVFLVVYIPFLKKTIDFSLPKI